MVELELNIPNAGLVILNGYLPYFFERCGYLDEAGLFLPDKAKRAAQVLQYVLDPEGLLEEEEMVLNKIICGIPVQETLPTDFEVNDLEKEISGQMIDALSATGHRSIIVHIRALENLG